MHTVVAQGEATSRLGPPVAPGCSTWTSAGRAGRGGRGWAGRGGQSPLGRVARRLSCDERGLSTVEYVILLVVIAALCVAAWNALGHEILSKLGVGASQVESVLGDAEGSYNVGEGETSSGSGDSPTATRPPAVGGGNRPTPSPGAGAPRNKRVFAPDDL